jgi:anaerobic magnesium-protoporphyrin IX monomethyl ester cyclase
MSIEVFLVVAPIYAAQKQVHRTELLGIEYLAGAARQAGFPLKVWDPTIGEGSPCGPAKYYFGPSDEEVEKRLRKEKPDILAISCHYGFSAENAYSIARIAKKVSPQCTVIMGGLFVSVNLSLAMDECAEIDYSIIGEADSTFIELLQCLNANEDASNIDGLIYRDGSSIHGNSIRSNPKTDYIDDLDALPLPARDLVPIDAYMSGSKDYQLYGLGFRPALSLLSSRSCPMGCSFCNMHLVHGQKWRPRSVESCMEELEEMSKRWDAHHVFIMDDFWNLKKDRAKEFCEGIIKRGIKIRWNTPNGISVKCMDPELAQLMKRSGCASTCIAIESGSERVRHEIMNKKTYNREIYSTIQCLSDADIPAVGFVIVGMPGETRADLEESKEFIQKLDLAAAVVSFAVPFRGTALYDELSASDDNVFDGSNSIDDYKHPILIPDGMTSQEIVDYKSELLGSFNGLGILAQIERENERQLQSA